VVWNNSIDLLAYITYVATSSTYIGAFVYVVGFFDPSPKDPNSCIILLLAQTQMVVLMQILVYWLVLLSLVV
jgi:hypothetical protein